MDFLTGLFNTVLENGRMSEEYWSVLVPSYSNYTGIKLMDVVEARVRREGVISSSFMLRRQRLLWTVDKYRKGQKQFHCVVSLSWSAWIVTGKQTKDTWIVSATVSALFWDCTALDWHSKMHQALFLTEQHVFVTKLITKHYRAEIDHFQPLR